MRFFHLSWLWFVVLVGLLPQTLLAAGFTVTPFSQEITIADEERVAFNVSVKNEGATETKLRLTAIDFGSLDVSGGAAFLGTQGNPETQYTLANWISLDQQELNLSPEDSAVVNGLIENRPDLAPGGHYGAILFRESDTAASPREANYIAVDQAFAALLMVKKMGGGLEKLELLQMEYPKSFFQLPEKILLTFENQGNIHVTPRGKVALRDALGRSVAEGILNEESGIILPGSKRIFSFKTHELKTAFFPGYYQLFLEYRFDGRDASETWEERVFVFPLITGLSLLGMATLAVFFRWRIWKKRLKKATKIQA